MMLKPSIDLLLEKIPSKYSLVIVSSKRAHELDEGAAPTIENFESSKNVGRALEEIVAGDIGIDPDPELKREIKKREEEIRKMEEKMKKRELETRIMYETKRDRS